MGQTRAGVEINTIDEWKRGASTRGDWQAGYSAEELARLWLTAAGPAAVVDALRPALPGVVLCEAIAEAQTRF